MRKVYYLIVLLSSLITLALSLLSPYFLVLFSFILPYALLGLYDISQKKYAILRNYPVLGHLRYLLIKIRPEIHQYFVESNSDGAPFSYEKRSVVYQRSRKQVDTLPFGTQRDTTRIGYEWINHSLNPQKIDESSRRVLIGGPDCKKPYSASIFNISAMSYGALSKNAIRSLNAGAKQGGFAHNTGEGGLTQHHLQEGGDLIWQIGTGYFGCRTLDGHFCPDQFKEKSQIDNVKMIEIKLSQGAKPGHGGILPGAKVSAEIAEIRGVPKGVTVNSPPVHSTFSTPIGLMNFIQQLRTLSGGKPVGFKLCLGKRREFYALCKAMIKTKITPDFISVDGGEGGTGSAPLEFSNSIGTPLTEALIEVDNALIGFGLRKNIKLIAAGKITTGFGILKNLSLGADVCYSARAFMLSLGCIQALQCNTDSCPTGIATQNPAFTIGLNYQDKKVRVYNFHQAIIESTFDILEAAGVKSMPELRRWHILKRVEINSIKNYSELFPYPDEDSFNQEIPPLKYRRVLNSSSAESF